MPTFNSINGGSNGGDFKDEVVLTKNESNTLVAKVFGVMFIGLLITALIAGGLGITLSQMIINADAAGDEAMLSDLFGGMMIGMVVSAIGLIVLSIIIPITAFRAKHSVLVPFILYILFMGVMLSMFVMFIEWYILAEAALITAVTFGAISLIGLASKGRIPGLGLTIMGLFIGIGFLSLTNLILMLFGQDVDALYWFVEFLFLALMMFISIYDIRNINNLASKGASANNNIVLYCAFIIYSDVISIFIRLVYLLARFSKK